MTTKHLINEGLYLLREERFIETNKDIYKIGRSNRIYKRVSNYPNGTIVYLMIACTESEQHERYLIDIFNNKFIKSKYYGNEYFEGDLNQMKNTIINYIKSISIADVILINNNIKIETVNKNTKTTILKSDQELYTKAILCKISMNKPKSFDEIIKTKYTIPCYTSIVKPYIDMHELQFTDVNIPNIINSNIQYIYPFGYENIDFLTDSDVLEILKSSNCLTLLDKIYSQTENNNFMKFSKKDKQIMYFNAPDDITYSSDKEFIIKMYAQSKLLLLRVYFKHCNRLSNTHKYIIWQNIHKINTELDNKSKKIPIEYECLIIKHTFNDIHKKHFINIKNEIEAKSLNIIAQNKKAFNKSQLSINTLNNDINTETLDINILNGIWNELHNNSGVYFDKYDNNLLLHHYTDIPRYKLIQKLILKEIDYKNNHYYTMGNIIKYQQYVSARIDKELNLIKITFSNISDEYINEIKKILTSNITNEEWLLSQQMPVRAQFVSSDGQISVQVRGCQTQDVQHESRLCHTQPPQ